MASVFTKIINGELPGRFLYKDDKCVAFLTIAPLKPGHTLVVPREEIDHWIDLPADLAAHLMIVAQQIGRAIQAGFMPAKVATTILGLEVPHTHIHVVPINAESDMHFEKQDRNAKAEDLDAAAETIRQHLRSVGVEGVAD